MNRELIKNLYYQAVRDCLHGQAWEFEQVFAELVVNEVINVVALSSKDNPIPDIREHFDIGEPEERYFLKPMGA